MGFIKTILMLLLFCSASLKAVEKTNFIIILTDDMGYGDVGFTGSKDAQTPQIDKLAKSGTIFTQAYAAASVCGPSRCGLITGRYQQKFGIFTNGHADKGLPKNQLMISQLLKSEGYTTGIIGKWHMGSKKGNLPNDRGFDHFYGFHYGAHDYYEASSQLNPKKKNTAPIYRNGESINFKKGSYLTEELSREACDFISSNKEKTFFLYLAYNGIHSPWQAPQKYLDRIEGVENEYRKLLLAMTLAVDDGVGQIVETLKKAGIDKKTAIFFMADNGTPKIGNKSPNSGVTRMSSTLGLRGYKGDSYEGGIRVPCFMYWPQALPSGVKYTKPVISQDIVSTITSYVGIAPKNKLDGVNLIPYLNNKEADRPHENLYWYREGKPHDFAIRHRDWKLTFNDQEGTSKTFLERESMKPMLFNLADDPYETTDLKDKYPEKFKELLTLYKKWRASHAVITKKSRKGKLIP
jgi:arylsulfatase A-like enzyme